MYKWFGVEPMPCPVCEVLREQLANSERERRELLQRALAPTSTVVEKEEKEDLVPIKPTFVPWRVRQQMLEQEDRKQAELLRRKTQEIEGLEKELGIGG